MNGIGFWLRWPGQGTMIAHNLPQGPQPVLGPMATARSLRGDGAKLGGPPVTATPRDFAAWEMALC